MSLVIELDRPRSPAARLAPVPIVLVAAFAGAVVVGDTALTGERLWAGAFAGLMALAGVRCRPWTWVLLAGAAAVACGGTLRIAALALLVLAVAAGVRARPVPAVGAAIVGSSALLVLAGRELSPPVVVAVAALPVAVVAISALANAHRSERLWAVSTALTVAALAIAAIVGYGLAALDARDDALAGIDDLRDGFDAAEAQEPEQATAFLRSAATRLDAAASSLERPWAEPARWLPVVGRNVRAVDTIAARGRDLAQVAADAAGSIDLDDVSVVDGRLDLTLAERVRVASVDVSDALARTRADLVALDSPWIASPLADRIDEALDTIDEAEPTVRNVRDAATIAPLVLGGDRPKRYLVLFTTPSETRARVGFPGNFGELEAVDGRVTLVRFGRLQDLLSQGVPVAERTLDAPFDFVSRYGRFAPAQTWAGIALSPDVPTVAALAAQLYPQSGGRPVDGVLTVNPAALAALLELTGPVRVAGLDTPVSAQNALSFLAVQQYVDFRLADRVDLLEEVARATFDRLTNLQIPSIRRASDVLSPAVRDGHLHFVSFEQPVNTVLQRVGIDGAMPPVAGDNLAVITNNAGGNKIDAFLERRLAYDVDWNAGDGSFDATLRVQLTNTAPATGLPDYIIGNLVRPAQQGLPVPPKGTNRQYLSVYTPWFPTLASVEGTATPLQVEQELGRWAATSLVDIPAGGTATLVFRWSGRLEPADVYLLDLVEQPLIRADRLDLRVTERSGRALRAEGATVSAATATRSGEWVREERIVVRTTP